MLKILVSVYDSKKETYSDPIYVPAKGEAVRSFIDLINDKQTIQYKHPEDFTLWYMGQFDDNKGTYITPSIPECLAKGIEVKESE